MNLRTSTLLPLTALAASAMVSLLPGTAAAHPAPTAIAAAPAKFVPGYCCHEVAPAGESDIASVLGGAGLSVPSDVPVGIGCHQQEFTPGEEAEECDSGVAVDCASDAHTGRQGLVGLNCKPLVPDRANSPVPAARQASAGAAPARPAADWPAAKRVQRVSATIKVPAGTKNYDFTRFVGTGALGGGDQTENQQPILELADGATISNVILGFPAADGIHCRGTCTLKNVWWEDVGEDAATFKGTRASQTMTIDGGGARKAADKVFQHNGPGTFVIRNFKVENFGKLYRSCGVCKTQYQRHVIVDNVTVKAPGVDVVGINPTPYGDTAKLTRITILGDPGRKIVVCQKFRGVTSGNPPKTGTGPDGRNCIYRSTDITYK